MPGDRTPIDGMPYYCNTCGCGLGEFMACEEVDCELELQSEAQARREKALADAADATRLRNAEKRKPA